MEEMIRRNTLRCCALRLQRFLAAFLIYGGLSLASGCVYQTDRTSNAEFQRLIDKCLVSRQHMMLVRKDVSWSMDKERETWELYACSSQPAGHDFTCSLSEEARKAGNYLLKPGLRIYIRSVWTKYNWAVSNKEYFYILVEIDDPQFRHIRVNATSAFFPDGDAWRSSRHIDTVNRITLDRFESCP